MTGMKIVTIHHVLFKADENLWDLYPKSERDTMKGPTRKRGTLIKTRIGTATDLVAEEAVYHSRCEAKFFDDKSKKKIGRGRPSNTPSIEALEKLCSYLES